MPRICPLCNKGSMMVMRRKKLRGNYNPTVKKRKSPNLQWARLPLAAAKKIGIEENARAKICTRCLRTLYKPKRNRSKNTQKA